MRKGTLRLLGLLLVAAGALIAAGCQGASKWFITGSIDGTTYEENGYVLAGVDSGNTVIMAADSLVDMSSFRNTWIITFPGVAEGTFTEADLGAEIAYYVDAFGTGEAYLASSLTIVVTTYASDEVAGTFSGIMAYSEDPDDHPFTGEFRAQL